MSEAFERLSRFINEEMRMSYIYQPEMLIHLLENGGQASTTSIAKAILLQDPTQVKYYEERVRQQPGRVLTENHQITEQIGESYKLAEFDHLNGAEIAELITNSHYRLSAYLKARGEWRWSHRG